MRITLSKHLINSLKETLPEGYDVEEAIAAILSAFASGKFIRVYDCKPIERELGADRAAVH